MTAPPPKKRGGARAGAGVKAKDGSTKLIKVFALRIREDQQPKLKKLGGSVWVRRKIDEEGD
jgi:hypothetical protein